MVAGTYTLFLHLPFAVAAGFIIVELAGDFSKLPTLIPYT